MKNLITVAILLTFTGLFAETVAACTCPKELDENGKEIPRDDFVWASHVFSGKLVSVSTLESRIGPYAQKAVFRVDEIWKGKRGADGIITLYLVGGECDPPFEVNEKYLVYAERSRFARPSQTEQTMLSPTFCGDTGLLKHAKKRLKSLRNRKVDRP